MQKEHAETWEIYTSSWKSTSEQDRQHLFEQALDPACKYTDPLESLSGFSALSTSIAAFQTQFPGAHFVTKQFWSHRQTCLARWEMRAASGTVLGEGASFGEFNDNGKLSSLTGFFDVPPQE